MSYHRNVTDNENDPINNPSCDLYYSLGAPVLVDGWKPFQEYNSIWSLRLDGKMNILLQILILHYSQHSGNHFSVDSQTVSPLTFPPLFTWPSGPKFTWRIVDPGDVSPVEEASSGVGMEGGGSHVEGGRETMSFSKF